MRRFSWLVFTNCDPAHEAEFDDWYDNIHLPDVLNVPGVVAARRLKLAAGQATAEDDRFFLCDVERNGAKFGNLAIYEIEADDEKAVLEHITGMAGTADMELSPYLNEVYTVMFKHRDGQTA